MSEPATSAPSAQPLSSSGADSSANDAAARLIQRNYRGYRTRRSLAGCNISADARWNDAVSRMRINNAAVDSRNSEKNDVASRWKRGGVLVGQLAGSPGTGPGAAKGKGKGDDGPVEGGPSLGPEAGSEGGQHAAALAQRTGKEAMVGDVPGANENGKVDNIPSIAGKGGKHEHGLRLIERWTRGAKAQELSKAMEEAYWLEMVDTKHRYGSNLKHYHAEWSKADTKDNFFKWLDEGEGKKLDLEECPRELLEKERITYLSAEQRANYVVDIHKGKLYWRRNGKPVDTTKGKHKDLGNGQGIVEKGEEEQQEEARLRQARREERAAQRGGSVRSISDTSDDSSVSSSDEDTEEEEERKHDAEHYGAGEKSKKKMLSSKGWTDALLRKTVGANTWIYVINSRYELYVGIKQTGKFQHSSFLFGGRVLSAGLLKAKDGVLTSLSPLSGHYRAGTAHFRHFVASLQESGVDLEHVTLSKSLLMLYALEKYGKVSKKLKPKKGKKNEDQKEVEKHHHTQRTELKKEEEATLSKSQSNASDVGQQGKKHHHWLHLPRTSASSSSLSDAASAASISSTPSSPRVKTARDKPKTLLERTKESRRAKEGLSAPTSDVEASPRSSTDGTLSRLMHKTGLRKD